jgi:hypothetical protein
MGKKVIVADAAANLFMLLKTHGIWVSGDSLRTTPDNSRLRDLERLLYTKAIAYMAGIALERPIGLVTAGYMYEVLLVDHDNDFKRVHGEDFPSELTDAGWRSSFKAIYDYVAGYID